MKRLSLEELKAQKAEQVKENLEAVSGGKLDLCHVWQAIKDIYHNGDMMH